MLIRGLAEMTEPLCSRVVVPVANRDDAAATATTFVSERVPAFTPGVTGDVTHTLVRSSDIPVLVLPDREETEIRCNQNIVTKR